MVASLRGRTERNQRSFAWMGQSALLRPEMYPVFFCPARGVGFVRSESSGLRHAEQRRRFSPRDPLSGLKFHVVINWEAEAPEPLTTS